MTGRDIRFIDGPTIRATLSHDDCIVVVREAMKALSDGRTRQLQRAIIGLGEGRLFGLMPGALGERDYFGAKLVSVFDDPQHPGHRSHQGVVVLFEGEGGMPVAVVNAEEITLIRTAAASAVATDALARPDAAVLAVLGCGGQAEQHIAAISRVRRLDRVLVWGRSFERAAAFAARNAAAIGLAIEAVAEVPEAVAAADIICTVTSAAEPVLHSAWVRPGTHVNVVGSSVAGPVEIDDDLVVRSRFIADSRASVLAAGAEFLKAKAAGLVDDAHIVAEIGEVLLGRIAGRRDPCEITLYKSLGHTVQDLAAAAFLYRRSIA